MAAFTDEAEVYAFLGGIFRRGMADPELVEKLKPSCSCRPTRATRSGWAR